MKHQRPVHLIATALFILPITPAATRIEVDSGMQGTDGVNVARRLRAVSMTTAVAILTLRGDQDTRAQAQQAGAQALPE